MLEIAGYKFDEKNIQADSDDSNEVIVAKFLLRWYVETLLVVNEGDILDRIKKAMQPYVISALCVLDARDML